MSAIELTRAEFAGIRDLVGQVTGVALADGKEYLVEHRIGPLVAEAGCASYADFLRMVKQDIGGTWYGRLVDAITTHETSFFRDGHPYAAIEEVVLPWLLAVVTERKRRPYQRKGPKVRVWCAAASTGQEPYSLAMLVHEHLARRSGCGVEAGDVSILATDISSQVLATAMAGRYPTMMMHRGLSEERRQRWFTAVGADWWEADHRLREMVEFRYLNLLEPFCHLGGCDVILCRNVLIYFQAEVRRAILEQMRDLLVSGGYLILGAAESMDQPLGGFESERVGATTLYRRVE